MTTDISDLMNALQQAVDAQHEYNKARDEYQGYSWDWNGRHYDALKEAQDDFEKAIGEYIDERIAIALKGT